MTTKMRMKKTLATLALSALLASTGLASAGETVGPNGEKATPSSALTLSDAEIAKLKDGKYTAALL